MTSETVKPGIKELQERLEALDINVAQSSDHDEPLFTVYSTCEPLFCFDGYDENEVKALAIDTLRSYARTFYNLENINLDALIEPVPQPLVRIERVQIESKLRPVFDLAA